jgi:hypothetical protein
MVASAGKSWTPPADAGIGPMMRKESQDMLTSQQAQGKTRRPHGSDWPSLAELRRQLEAPSAMTDGNRQRLRELAGRLARVQALGGGYVRVGLSQTAETALRGPAVLA